MTVYEVIILNCDFTISDEFVIILCSNNL